MSALTKKELQEKYKTNMTQLAKAGCTCRDAYCNLIYFVANVPALLVYAFAILLQLPLLLGCSIYGCTLSRPTERVRRGCSFHVLCAILFPLTMPLIALAFVWTWVLRLYRFVLCFPVGLCRRQRTKSSWAALQTFSGAVAEYSPEERHARSPADILAGKFWPRWQFMDFVIAFIGAIHRQSICELFFAVPGGLAFVPPMKVLLYTNAYLFDLKVVYTNQWSDPLDATGDYRLTARDEEIIKNELKPMVFNAKAEAFRSKLTDPWRFAGHYPYPPPDRESRTVIGMQYSDWLVRTALLTHTTHAYDVPGHTPRSTHATWNLCAVHLASWNPFHFFTGYVEVNVRKDGGIEHPMWLCMDPQSRIHLDYVDGVNKLFVELLFNFEAFLHTLPSYQNELRAGPPAP